MRTENLEGRRPSDFSLLRSKFAFLVLLAAGVLIRVAALSLPGTRDVGTWKIWTYSGAINPPTTLYGVGGSPPERRLLDFHGAETTVDYPPLALAIGGVRLRWSVR